MTTWTDKTLQKALRDAKASGDDVWRTDASKARGVGRLRFRARPGGHGMFYFRYTSSAGRQEQTALGVYDIDGRHGLSLRQALEKAGELSRLYQNGVRDLREYLEHSEAEERARREEAKRQREEAERKATSGTLQALCDSYVAHLERQGKQSAADVKNLFALHVVAAFPHLAAMRAASLTHKDISAILAKLIEKGHGRTAGKLRSYLRAAFSCALQAEGDPTVHPDLHGFELSANPAAIVPAKALAKFNKARDRALNESELRAFLHELDKQPQRYADAIRLTLFLGGQRPAQLVRARAADVDLDAKTLTLYDIKGARQNARAHVLPLTDSAQAIVERMLGDDFLIASRNNGAAVRPETLSKVAAEISAAMVEAKTAREPFELGDFRRTCETMLAAMGVSKDVRAQIQSHGLGGVQARHYDRHEYMAEKLAALEAWERKLKEIESGKKPAKVVPLRARGKK